MSRSFGSEVGKLRQLNFIRQSQDVFRRSATAMKQNDCAACCFERLSPSDDRLITMRTFHFFGGHRSLNPFVFRRTAKLDLNLGETTVHKQFRSRDVAAVV